VNNSVNELMPSVKTLKALQGALRAVLRFCILSQTAQPSSSFLIFHVFWRTQRERGVSRLGTYGLSTSVISFGWCNQLLQMAWWALA
jgi:hypothetical protein